MVLRTADEIEPLDQQSGCPAEAQGGHLEAQQEQASWLQSDHKCVTEVYCALSI